MGGVSSRAGRSEGSLAGWSCHLTPSGGHSHLHQLHKATCALRCANLNLYPPPAYKSLSWHKKNPHRGPFFWETSFQTTLFQVALLVSSGGEGRSVAQIVLSSWSWPKAHLKIDLIEKKSFSPGGNHTLAETDERLLLPWKWMVLAMDILLQPMTQPMHNMVKHI